LGTLGKSALHIATKFPTLPKGAPARPQQSKEHPRGQHGSEH